MPRGFQKSKSLIRKLVRTPGGRLVEHFIKRKHSAPRCAKCGRPLLGIPHRNSLKVKLPKSKRAPKRPYGGVLCSKCSRELIKQKAGVGNV